MTEADPVVKRAPLTTVEITLPAEDMSLIVTLSLEVKGRTLVFQIKTKADPLRMLRSEKEGLVMVRVVDSIVRSEDGDVSISS